MDFGNIYKLTSGNKIYLWHIIVKKQGNKVYEISSHGEDGGKIVMHIINQNTKILQILK